MLAPSSWEFFNNNLFTRKIDIDAPVDENEMFNPSDVFSRIIAKIEEEINDIQKTVTDFQLTTSQTYKANKIILALGNFLPAHPHSKSKDFIGSENYFQNAFHPSLIQNLATKKNITIPNSKVFLQRGTST